MRFELACWVLALCACVAPVWATEALPMVDLPQHLHLISVLHRLGDPSTLYPAFFDARPGFTPYLGYYYAVSALNWLLPLLAANRVFLTLVLLGLPLSAAFLLRSLGRQTWPALLTIPFGYGDNFAWGFINYLAAVPLALLTAGLFIRAITFSSRKMWAGALAVSLLLVLAFHVQLFLWLAGALPLLLLLTCPPEGYRCWTARAWALGGVVPAVALSLLWVYGRLSKAPDIAYGQPWKAWGPMFSAQNVNYKSFDTNKAELLSSLANMLRSQEDADTVKVLLLFAAVSLVVAWVTRHRGRGRWFESIRLPMLLAYTLALFFLLPFDIRGFVYSMNPRYASLCATLFVCVPSWPFRFQRFFMAVATLMAVVFGVRLTAAFVKFDAEHEPLRQMTQLMPRKARVMGLMFQVQSEIFRHPLYLHAAAELALASTGVSHFSFASTPHSPLMFKEEPPPTFASEWDPSAFNWSDHGFYYDAFLLRGISPPQLPSSQRPELVVTFADRGWFLVEKGQQK
jgi:hypothetical protein